MGDWCGSFKLTPEHEITDAVNTLESLVKFKLNWNFNLARKDSFFLNGVLYSLDEGLLMGDPPMAFCPFKNLVRLRLLLDSLFPRAFL
jgi:hypothetical protein